MGLPQRYTLLVNFSVNHVNKNLPRPLVTAYIRIIRDIIGSKCVPRVFPCYSLIPSTDKFGKVKLAASVTFGKFLKLNTTNCFDVYGYFNAAHLRSQIVCV